MRHCPLTYVTFFENFDLGETVSKRKKWTFLKLFRNVRHFENPRWQFCCTTISTSFHIMQLIVALTLAPLEGGGAKGPLWFFANSS